MHRLYSIESLYDIVMLSAEDPEESKVFTGQGKTLASKVSCLFVVRCDKY